ncbi:MAG: LysM peptidoglycan-binding domain-containing protein, partial [Geminicoccaceae bacterium]
MNKKLAASMTNRHKERQPIFRPVLPATAVLIALSVLTISACTTYQPLGHGSSVPWAAALSADNGGAIDDGRYRVGVGDWLSGIAERYGVRLATLAAANNIEPPYILYPGEVLRIPPNVPVPTDRPISKPAPAIGQVELPGEPVRQPEPSPPKELKTATTTPVKTTRLDRLNKRVVVAPGESLSVIAGRHGLRLAELVAANKIEPPYQVRPGQVLIIPPNETERKRQSKAAKPSDDRQSVVAPPPLSGEGFLWPVEGRLISGFDQNAKKGRSGGVAIAARKGTPVRAADNGIVAYAGEALSGYG